MKDRIITKPGPTLQNERILSLDILRAFALMGILVVNITIFAIPIQGGFTYAFGDSQGINYWVTILTEMLFQGYFFPIFSMLFGAGVCLMAQRLEDKGLKSGVIHYRRMFWLIVIGFLHSGLLWRNDILFSYGFTGLVLYPFYKMSAKKTLVYTIIAMSLVSIQEAQIISNRDDRGSRTLQVRERSRQQDKQLRQQRMEQFKVPWWDLVKLRVTSRGRALLRLSIWKIMILNLGFMLLGMTLLKFGFFTGKAPPSLYKIIFLIGLTIGLVLPILKLILKELDIYQLASVYRPKNLTFWESFFQSFRNRVVHFILPFTYMSGIILLAQWGKLKKLTAYMAAMGRMALTNYIMMSLLCTTLFYGYGWNLYGKLDRTSLILIVFAILAFQMWFSYHWLSLYRFGPLEWLWRSLTYRRHQPMKLPKN